MKERVDLMYADGRTTSLSTDEMEAMVTELTKGER